jgi:hypothetical protein
MACNFLTSWATIKCRRAVLCMVSLPLPNAVQYPIAVRSWSPSSAVTLFMATTVEPGGLGGRALALPVFVTAPAHTVGSDGRLTSSRTQRRPSLRGYSLNQHHVLWTVTGVSRWGGHFECFYRPVGCQGYGFRRNLRCLMVIKYLHDVSCVLNNLVMKDIL